MTINHVLADILDEAVKALSNLDSAELHALKQRIIVLAKANAKYESSGVDLALSKSRQLEILLQNCQTNLDALTRLNARNMRNQWAQ
jgi:hypothetical protein